MDTKDCTVLVVLFVLFCVVSLCLSKPSRTQFPVRNYSGSLSLALSCRFREKGALCFWIAAGLKGHGQRHRCCVCMFKPNTDYDLIKNAYECLWILWHCFWKLWDATACFKLGREWETLRKLLEGLYRDSLALLHTHGCRVLNQCCFHTVFKEISELILFFSRILFKGVALTLKKLNLVLVKYILSKSCIEDLL